MAEKDNRRSGGDSLERHSSSRIATRRLDDYLNEPNLTSSRRSSRRRTLSATVDENIGFPRSKKRKVESDSSTSKLTKGKGERSSLETVTEVEGTSSSSREAKNSSKKSRAKKNNWNISEQSKNNNSASTSKSGVKINKNNNIFIVKTNRRRRVTESSDTTEEDKEVKPTKSSRVKRAHSKDTKEKKPEKTKKAKSGKDKTKKSRRKEEKKSNISQKNSATTTETTVTATDQGSESRVYALRNQVRLDPSGALIPLYPPSRAEIAIAQGRKPFTPRKSKSTTAWNVSLESSQPEDKTDNRKKDPEITVGPQFRVTLRRSARSKHNTGSCASTSSRRSSRAGKVGAGSSWAMMSAGQGPSTAAPQGPSTSEEAVPAPATAPTLGSETQKGPEPFDNPGSSCEQDVSSRSTLSTHDSNEDVFSSSSPRLSDGDTEYTPGNDPEILQWRENINMWSNTSSKKRGPRKIVEDQEDLNIQVPPQRIPGKPSICNALCFAPPDITRHDDIDLNIHLLDEMWAQPLSVAHFQLISLNPTYVTSIEPRPVTKTERSTIPQPPPMNKKRGKSMLAPSTSAQLRKPKTQSQSCNVLNVGTEMTASASGTTTVRESYELTSESDDNNEVGRLQALLESRGLPPHLFGALGPRMQHLLNRSMGVSSSSKAQQLLQGLQASGDESQQLQAVIEMCQMLIMGNEDTLTGFPVKDVVPALITLLTMDHNFVMMNHACRALTYMMEALPRSSAVVVDAVPVFLEKLQEIQCMDVAEQSLTALETLSRRHSKSILQARGVAACLKYLDFFSIAAQRAALAVTANCCQNLHVLELNYVADSLPILAARLTRQSDKKCVESICLAFCRLVDSFQNDPTKLQEIASPELLTNLQQLLVESPPVISTSTFISVLRMLTIMCSACPDLALTLLKQNIADTLCYLFTGSAEKNTHFEVELVSRSPQELYEMTCLIGELMPKLPSDGIFVVDALLERPNNAIPDTVQWQWRDEQGHWHPYGSWDSRMIEAAHQNGEPEILLNSRYSTYTINLHSMTQISEDYVTSWAIRRRVNPAAVLGTSQDGAPSLTNNYLFIVTEQNNGNSVQHNSSCGPVKNDTEERELASSFVRSLFSTLYEVYSSSAGPAVRYKCLKALLRMVYFSSPDLLKEVLRNQVVSSHIAGMLASHDLRIVVGALQMANILMQKLADVFTVRFMREGVTHQIKQLASVENVPETPPSVPSVPVPSTSSSGTLSFSSSNSGINGNMIQNDEHNVSSEDNLSQSPSQLKLSDVLSRKRKSKRGSTSSNRSKNKHEEALPSSMMQDIISKATSLGTSGRSTPTGTSRSRFAGAGAKTSSFLASLNPARWGRSPSNSSAHGERQFQKESGLSKSPSNSNLTAGSKEKVRCWVRETAQRFIEIYFSEEVTAQLPAADVLSKLTQLISKMHSSDLKEEGLPALKELCDILKESDISPFEVNHSGLVEALLEFLTYNSDNSRDDRLRTFLHVFADCPLDPNGSVDNINSHCLSLLVTKLNNCVSQLEQFPVKVHDLPAGAGGARGGTSALKFFNTHQLKCNLQRHPDCTNLKQWKGGSVKIDPLALVQAIERYLVVRGYGRIRGHDSGESDDDNSEDDDIDDTLAAVVISQGTARHQLQFLIGDHVLPYNMTVYQAVRQFTNQNNQDQSETDTDTEMPLGHSGVWVQTHTIQYRPAPPNSGPTNIPPGRKHKGSTNKSQRKSDQLWNEGIVPPFQSPLAPFLTRKLPDSVTIQDSSLQVLNLLRVLHALSRYWGTLYNIASYSELLSLNCFINSKISAKASRQLQDPLVIMTGNLPLWLQQIAVVCPFLLPFETRQLLFYATSFDRDRALQRLLDATPDLSSSDSSERVTPKLDRRKRTISREDILKQAELVIQDLASSRALLEVQYENEVGTGLGPTLEFYALVSRELQRADLELWAGERIEGPEGTSYIHAPQGLFPAPLSRSSKYTHTHLTKIKSKFRFLGKFMAKAVMDSRLLDMPFSLAFYRWLLGQEGSLHLPDLVYVAPQVHQTIAKMQSFLRRKASGKTSISDCDDFGCSIEDFCLDFTLPGYSDLELRKGGKDILVTEENLEQYIKLVCHWLLVEGVSRQMEALREGFETVFPLQQLHMFYPEELDAVFCGSGQQMGWDVKTLSECFRPDHGYTLDSKAIRFLFDVLSSYNATEQRLFLQFVTGSPRLPVGGFKSLSPPLTVVRKDVEGDACSDNFLPSVMTCVNYLKLPDYSSLEVMRQRLGLAAREGSHSFHLS